MVDDDQIDTYREQLDDGEAIETTVRRLRREGHSRQEAVYIILEILDLSLAEAKRVLLTHDTWGNAREAAPDADDASPSVPPAPG